MKKSEFKNPDAPATKRQTYAIFCMAKQDVRQENLTRWEASQIISRLKDGKPFALPEKSKLEVKTLKPFSIRMGEKPTGKKDYRKIFFEAIRAGENEMAKCVPTPMIVEQHSNPLDDNSPVTQQWHVPGGVCGFAWIHFRCKGETGKFIREMKKKGIAGTDITCSISKDNYRGGYLYWVHHGNQSMELKIAFARGFAEYMGKQGIECTTGSRMD